MGRLLHAVKPTNLVAFLVLLTIVAVFLKSCQKTTIVEEFEVPRAISDMGYTPRVVALRIIDNIQTIHDISELTMNVAVLGAWQHSELDIEVSTTGFSVKSFVSELLTLFPVQRTVISGELLQDPFFGGLSLRVRRNGDVVTDIFHEKWENCSQSAPTLSESVRLVFSDAAARVMVGTDPFVLAAYYYEILQRYPIGSPAHDQYMWNIERLIGIIEKNKGLDIDTRYRTTILHGLLFLDHRIGQEDAAITKFNEALQMSRDRALARVNLGVAYARKAEPEMAISHIERAISVETTFGAMAHAIWGEILFKMAENSSDNNKKGMLHEKSLERFERAIRLDQDSVRAYAGRGQVRYLQGDKDGAVDDFKIVVELDPSYYRGIVRYGWLLSEAGEYSEAIKWYKRATEVDPYESDAYDYWTNTLNTLKKLSDDGAALTEDQQLAVALRHLQLELRSDRISAEIARSHAFAKAGSCEKAEELNDSAEGLRDRWSNSIE